MNASGFFLLRLRALAGFFARQRAQHAEGASASFSFMNQITPRRISLAKPFVWHTHNEGDILPSQMKTSHLFYTVRMIFNHTVPEHKRIPGCKYWTLGRSPQYYREALITMLRELKQRSDVTPQQLTQLAYMRNTAVDLLRIQLN